MKTPFQKDDLLLADIAAARQRGTTRIWWLGQSGFLLCTAGRSLLFDPYLSDSLTRKYAGTDKPHVRLTERVIAPERLTGIHWITSSHNHTDHLDSETLQPLLAANPAARLLVPCANVESIRRRLGCPEDRLVAIDAGQSLTLDGVKFHGIASAHNNVDKDASGRCLYLGYVARIGPLTIYHSGDTIMHPGLEPSLMPLNLDLALLPINGNKPERKVAGNLNGPEAARLAKAVSARRVIPHHFDLFEFNTASPDEFEAECRRLGQLFVTLRNGEGTNL